MDFGMCNEVVTEFGERGIADGLQYLSDLGYDGVEIAPWTLADSVEDISEEHTALVRDAAERADIDVVGLHWVFGEDSSYDVMSPDRRDREDALDYLLTLVEVCAEMGGDIVVFGSPNQRTIPEGVDYDTGWGYAMDVLANERLLGRLEEADVTFVLEPIAAEYTNFATTPREVVDFVEAVDHPNFEMMLDAHHTVLTHDAEVLPDLVRECAPYLAHFHADDETGHGPGIGTLEYRDIARALDDVGYDGYVSIEIHEFDLDVEELAPEWLAYLEETFAT